MLRVVRLPAIPGIECVVVNIFLNECNLILGGFCRPPNSGNIFFENLKLLCAHKSCSTLLVGNFNALFVNWESDCPEASLSTYEFL